MCGDSCMDHLTRAVVNNKEDVECSKPECLNGEEVAGPDLIGTRSQELPPARGGHSVIGTAHVFRDCAGTNIDSEASQFSLDSALTPQRVFASHAPDKLPDLRRYRLSTHSSQPSGFPPPVCPPALAVPAKDSFRLNNDQTCPPLRKPTTGKDPETTIGITNRWPYLAAVEDDQLLPKAEVLGDESRSGLEPRGEGEEQMANH